MLNGRDDSLNKCKVMQPYLCRVPVGLCATKVGRLQMILFEVISSISQIVLLTSQASLFCCDQSDGSHDHLGCSVTVDIVI